MLGLETNLKFLRSPVPADPDEREKKPKPQRWTHKALLPVRVLLAISPQIYRRPAMP